ncbi:DUF1489 family protein [Alphaproteobacteria bacterium LSUCC0684]
MPLHLKKLSVGSTSIESLTEWHDEVLKRRGRIMHTTRSFPRRAAEILPGGSMFWIIKGRMCVRQLIEEFVEIEREDGGVSCGIVLKPGLMRVVERRHRPFQGWRYLEEADAPIDLPLGDTPDDVMPLEMAEELRDLGLL